MILTNDKDGGIKTPCKINELCAHDQAKQPFSFSLLFSLLLFENLETLFFLYFIGDYSNWSG
jgi:hypothetical protein